MASTKTNDITHPITAPTESAARTAIALRLADYLFEHNYTAEDVADIRSEGRRAVACLAGVSRPALRPGYTPSDATWAATVAVLRDRETKPDPFAGFPS